MRFTHHSQPDRVLNITQTYSEPRGSRVLGRIEFEIPIPLSSDSIRSLALTLRNLEKGPGYELPLHQYFDKLWYRLIKS